MGEALSILENSVTPRQIGNLRANGASPFVGVDSKTLGAEVSVKGDTGFELPGLSLWADKEELFASTFSGSASVKGDSVPWFSTVQNRIAERTGDIALQQVLSTSLNQSDCIADILEIEIVSVLYQKSGVCALFDLFQEF